MPKRIQGYMLNLRLFVPVNPKDLYDTTSKSKAIVNATEWGDLSGIRAARVLKASHRYTSLPDSPDPGSRVGEFVEVPGAGILTDPRFDRYDPPDDEAVHGQPSHHRKYVLTTTD